MEDAVNYILRPGTLTIAVMVYVLTFFTRRTFELAFPRLKVSRKRQKDGIAGPKGMVEENVYPNKISMWWNDVFLYALPVFYGAILALSKSTFLYGEIDTSGGRMIFSAGVGWFSSFLYMIFRKTVLKKTGIDIQPESMGRPGSVPPESGGQEGG